MVMIRANIYNLMAWTQSMALIESTIILIVLLVTFTKLAITDFKLPKASILTNYSAIPRKQRDFCGKDIFLLDLTIVASCFLLCHLRLLWSLVYN